MRIALQQKTAKYLALTLAAGLVLFVSQCKPDGDDPIVEEPYKDKAYTLNTPAGFPVFIDNPNNPLTINGVELGRRLFYDVKLSGDNTMSCASCHKQEFSFSDAPNQFSKGIDGLVGDKNSMAIINMAWNRDFFWDGRRSSAEAQALDPVINPVEMHEIWPNAVAKIQADPQYPPLFAKAFGTEKVDSVLISRAIGQFMKTIVAGPGSRYLKDPRNLSLLTLDERKGFDVFSREDKGDCLHCHPVDERTFTDNYFDNPAQRFHNNGLNPDPQPGVLTGRAIVTGNPADNGKFKSPTLYNIELTAPYMHDGRFKTLEEVVEFYDTGVHASLTLDFNMNVKSGTPQRFFQNGKRKLNLTAIEKQQLVAFLKTLTDPTVATNPAYAKP